MIVANPAAHGCGDRLGAKDQTPFLFPFTNQPIVKITNMTNPAPTKDKIVSPIMIAGG